MKEAVFDVEVPVVTVTGYVSGNDDSAAVIGAVSRFGDTKVVVRLTPFQRTSELEVNPDPSTVNVNCRVPPAGARKGERLVMKGPALRLDAAERTAAITTTRRRGLGAMSLSPSDARGFQV